MRLDPLMDNLQKVGVFPCSLNGPIKEVDYPSTRRLIASIIDILTDKVWEEAVPISLVSCNQGIAFAPIEDETYAYYGSTFERLPLVFAKRSRISLSLGV